MNILLTNSGRRTYLINFLFALKKKYRSLRIFVSDSDINSSTLLSNKIYKSFKTTRLSKNKTKYKDEIINICKKNKIDILIPLIDDDLIVLSKIKKKLEDIGVTPIISKHDTIINCFNKKLNYKFCIKNKINIPKSYFKKNKTINYKNYLIKKISGSASLDMENINSYNYNNIDFKKFFIQKKIIGIEYGMDILNDLNGEFVHVCVKRKYSMRSGETDKSVTVSNKKFINMAKNISKIFGHIGNLDIDFIISKRNKIYFIDFNPRFGGGYPFTHISGYDYLDALIKFKNNNKVTFKNKNKKIVASKGIDINFKIL